MNEEIEDTWADKPRRGIERPSRPFRAQFDSICSGCGDVIETGDLIQMWLGGGYHHAEADDTPCLPEDAL